MKKIKLVDGIMGCGKTSYAIQMMNERKTTKFMFITPFIDEVERIMKACSSRDFVTPEITLDEETGTWNKFNGLMELLEAGKNIVSTHALFQRLTDEALDVIRAQGYVLIMDEVMRVLDPKRLAKDKIKALFEREVLKLEGDPEVETVVPVSPGAEERLDEYQMLRAQAAMGRLVFVSGHILMWLFPANCFDAFERSLEPLLPLQGTDSESLL